MQGEVSTKLLHLAFPWAEFETLLKFYSYEADYRVPPQVLPQSATETVARASEPWCLRRRTYKAGPFSHGLWQTGRLIHETGCLHDGYGDCRRGGWLLGLGFGWVLNPVMIFDTKTDTFPGTYRDYQAQIYATGREMLAHCCSGEIP